MQLVIGCAGVCDPWNEGQCVGTNSWLDCTKDVEFDCPHIHDPGTVTVFIPASIYVSVSATVTVSVSVFCIRVSTP